MEPRLWRWKEIFPALMEATEVIRIGPDSFRRNIGLQTGSKTLAMGFQIVLPGEAAAAHRHTNTAFASSFPAAAHTRRPMANRW